MFAAKVIRTIEIADGDGRNVAVTIRKLNWKQLRRASDAQTKTAMTAAADAGPELLKVMSDANKPAAKDGKEPTAAPDAETKYRSHDRDTTLRLGIVSWTAEVPLPDGIDDLDEASADQLHRAILDLSLPAVDEAARGEGSRQSTAS